MAAIVSNSAAIASVVQGLGIVHRLAATALG